MQILPKMAAISQNTLEAEEVPVTSHHLEIPYKNLLDFISSTNLGISSPLLHGLLCSFICQHTGVEHTNLQKNSQKLLGVRIKKFLTTIRGKKGSRSRHIERVLEDPWTKGKLLIPLETFHSSQQSEKKKLKDPTKKVNLKKKIKTFNTLSSRGKFLTAQRLRDGYDPEAIELAVTQTLTKAGKKDARFIFKKINSSTGLTAAKVRKSMEESEKISISKMTAEEGLGFLLRQNLTKAQYQAIRFQSKEKGADIWPPYHQVQEVKTQCRPDSIEVADHSAFVPLQELLNHSLH